MACKRLSNGLRSVLSFAGNMLNKSCVCSLQLVSLLVWLRTYKHPRVHPAVCLDTPERMAWITYSCFSLITSGHKLKVRSVSPDLSVEADWLKFASPQTYFTLLAVRYPICHTIPKHLQQSFLSGQHKAGIHSE